MKNLVLKNGGGIFSLLGDAFKFKKENKKVATADKNRIIKAIEEAARINYLMHRHRTFFYN